MDESSLQSILDQIYSFLATYGLRVLGAIVILIIGRIAAGILARALRKTMKKANVDPSLTGFVVSLVRTAVIIFAVLAALAKFGVQTTSFVAVLGAAGLAVGLALQGSLSNFASGVLILLFRPFVRDDVIKAAGITGKVVDIGIFTTTINTPDNQKNIVPNSAIMGGVITNVTAYDKRRVDLTAGIGYADDIAKAREVLLRILDGHEKILKDPAPVVEVVELGDSSVNFVVRPWSKTEDYWAVYFDVTRAIKEEFDREGISIPFPQRDVHLHQVAT